MPDLKVSVTTTVWETNPALLIAIASAVITIILITTFLVRRELKNEKTK